MEYKLNKYIHFHRVKDDVICLDLLQKYSITIPHENYLLIEKHKSDISGLKQDNKHLFSLLYKLGFIFDLDVDEFKIAKSKFNSEIFQNRAYRLTILPTMDCNFSCWYCYEEKVKGHMDTGMQERIISHVKAKISAGVSRIQLDWFGGEPLLSFDSVIVPLSKRIISLADENNVLFSNQITTNGYLLTDKSINQLNEIKMNNFQITLDGNEPIHNKIKKGKDAYKRTIKNINLLCNVIDNPEIMLRINFTDENLRSCLDIIEDIPFENRRKITINFQRVWQLKNNKDYYPEVNEVKQEFKDAGFNIFIFELKEISTCYADMYEQAVVNYNGSVFKCTARDFTNENAVGFIDEDGVIEWNLKKESNRFGGNAFEKYEQCKDCEILPACYGPCSQKSIETSVNEFYKICNYDGIKYSLNELLEKRYNEIFS